MEYLHDSLPDMLPVASLIVRGIFMNVLEMAARSTLAGVCFRSLQSSSLQQHVDLFICTMDIEFLDTTDPESISGVAKMQLGVVVIRWNTYNLPPSADFRGRMTNCL